MPTIESQIDRAKRKLLRDFPAAPLDKIEIYSEGLKSKFREAEYALWQIRKLCGNQLGPISVQATSTSSSDHYDHLDRVYFYVDSFFAFLYSTLDVMSQIINQQYSLTSDEEDVTFAKLVNLLLQQKPGSKVQLRSSSFKGKEVFSELQAYRNCSTHRRHIYIEKRLVVPPRGYTTTATIQPVSWIICDDPYSIPPTTARNKELLPYCEGTNERICKEVLKILRSF